MSAVLDKEVTDTEDAYVPTRHRLSVTAFALLEREGLLPPDVKIELIDGELFVMPPIGPLHNATVNDLNELLVLSLGKSAIVQCQGSIKLADYSAPQPDFAIFKPREDRYRNALAGPADILLLIEIADATAGFDRNTKAPLYARHGIAELWIVDLKRRVLEIYREPSERGYRTKLERVAGDSASPLALTDLSVDVGKLVGG